MRQRVSRVAAFLLGLVCSSVFLGYPAGACPTLDPQVHGWPINSGVAYNITTFTSQEQAALGGAFSNWTFNNVPGPSGNCSGVQFQVVFPEQYFIASTPSFNQAIPAMAAETEISIGPGGVVVGASTVILLAPTFRIILPSGIAQSRATLLT
jgi:hypothetical protein